MELPCFKYHPNPIETGSVKVSRQTCECCNQVRGYIYDSIVYSTSQAALFCPWCIASGAAAEKFDATFSTGYSLRKAGINEKIVLEICQKTPGYDCWQEDNWQHHCNDACEFLGDADKADLFTLTGQDLENFLSKEMLKPDDWKNILAGYQKGGDPAAYQFKCRHCSQYQYTIDFT